MSDKWPSYQKKGKLQEYNYTRKTESWSKDFVDPATRAPIQEIKSMRHAIKQK